MTDEITPISQKPSVANPKQSEFLFKGCLIVLLLLFLVLLCRGILVALPLMPDFDPFGLDLSNRIKEIIPWVDFIQDPFLILDLPDLIDNDLDPYSESNDPALYNPPSDARSIPLTTYTASDFPATFSYPIGWEIEIRDHQVTFYDPQNATFLFVGEEFVDNGSTAAQISLEFIESLQSDAESGTFNLFESSPYSVPTGDDAYLNSYEWTDSEGDYLWAFQLETVSGESNVYFFLEGNDPELAPLYGELIKIIAESFSR